MHQDTNKSYTQYITFERDTEISPSGSRESFSLFHHSVLICLECFSMIIHCNGNKAFMRAEHFLYFDNSRI